MTYLEARKIAKNGRIVKLPNFEGYFKWDYALNKFIFLNKDFKCDANKLDILKRLDFYYIT